MMFKDEIIETGCGPAVLKRSNRRTLAISVFPDGSLELAAPLHAAKSTIETKIQKRRKWIEAQRRMFRELRAVRPAHRYVNGSTHRYLGRQYRLKISQGQPSRVSLKGGYFEVVCGENTEPEVKRLMNAWLRQRAEEQLAKRLEKWKTWCHRHGLPEPSARLRSMAKRWGSAQRNGRIYFNPDLIKAPSICVDYVIIHEVCHLKHPRHDRNFFRLLAQLAPGWPTIKKRLEQTET